MSISVAALSQVSVSSNSAVLSSGVASGGTGPYTYQWYMSTTTGFTPGGGNIVAGATSQLNQSFSGLIPNTVYFFKVVATDSLAATGTSAQLSVTTTPTQLSQNVLQQSAVVGQLDMQFNFDTISAQVDVSAGASAAYYQGQAMKIVPNTVGGVPRVIAAAASNDNILGFINFDIKSVSFGLGVSQNPMMELSMAGNVMWLYATGAITQGNQVCLDVSASAAVQATGNSATVVGWALDGAAAAGALIRVVLRTPSFLTA